MNILIVNSFYYPHERGGAEKSVRILAENLEKLGNEVTVLALSDDNEEHYEKINNVSVVRLPINNLYHPSNFTSQGNAILAKIKKFGWHLIDTYNFKSLCDFDKKLNASDYDIVHTNNVSGFSVSIWDWASKNKLAIVHTSRDYYLFNPNCTLFSKQRNEKTSSIKIKLLSFIKKRKSSKVSAYVGISDFISKLHLENGFFKNSIISKVIYNGIGSKASKEMLSIRSNRLENIKNKPLQLGYLGRLDAAKGIEIIINYLKSSSISFTIKIGGGGNQKYVEHLKSICSGDDRFEFLGHVKIEEYFAKIDCLICSSLWNEPMGRVVIESFSYGVPVIGSRAGGISELITEGKTGFLFNTNDKESFFNALNYYSASDKHLISNNCYVESDKYSDEDYVNRYISVYRSVYDKLS